MILRVYGIHYTDAELKEKVIHILRVNSCTKELKVFERLASTLETRQQIKDEAKKAGVLVY